MILSEFKDTAKNFSGTTPASASGAASPTPSTTPGTGTTTGSTPVSASGAASPTPSTTPGTGTTTGSTPVTTNPMTAKLTGLFAKLRRGGRKTYNKRNRLKKTKKYFKNNKRFKKTRR